MLHAWAEALQDTGWARALAASLWVYPLVNVAHVAGIALLFGAIVPLDLRLAGCWRGVPLAALRRVLLPVAVAGLLLAVASGALLAAARAADYVGEPLFGLKLGLVGLALLNALWLRRSAAWRQAEARGDAHGEPLPAAWRFAGVASLVLWLAAITAGRLIGYR